MFGCSCCVIPPQVDPDLFDGRAFCLNCPSTSTSTSKAHLRINLCSGDLTLDADSKEVIDPIEETGADLFTEERRNVVARGMKRFEIEKFPPPQPDFEKHSDLVCSVLGQNPNAFTLNGTNCYLVGTGKKRILVDAGEAMRGLDEFLEILDQSMKQIGVIGLDAILITHLHGDHFGGCDRLLEKFGAIPVLMLKCPDWQLSLFTIFTMDQLGLIEYLERGPSPRNADGTFNPFTEDDIPAWPNEDLSWDPAGRNKVELQRDYFFMKGHINWYKRWYLKEGLYVNSRALVDGEVIRTEGATLRVMHTPGHSENHACFILEEEQSLLSGDHVLGYGTTVLNDLKTYMESLQAMLDFSPRRLYPGHGPIIQDGVGLLSRYIKHRQSRENQVVEYMKGHPDQRAVDIVDALYLDTPVERKVMARQNIEKILLKLWREKRATCYKEGQLFKLPGNLYIRRIEIGLTWRLVASSL